MVVVVVGALLAGVLLAPSAAFAATERDAVTDVSVASELSTPWQQTSNPSAVPDGTVVKTTVKFAVPDSAVAGDTTTLSLPAELSIAGMASFSVVASDGATIATAAASGGGTALVLTYSNYVNSHNDVTGQMMFESLVSVPAATATPAPVSLAFTSSGHTFPSTLDVYTVTELGVPGAFGIHIGSITGSTITWVYYAAASAFNLDLALMDGATSVNCSALQLTYRDAPYTGGAYPADSAFGSAQTPTASCTPISPGLTAASQVVSVQAAAAVPAATLREFRLTATITSATQGQFQAVLATTDPGSTTTLYGAGLVHRQLTSGTGAGTVIPPTPTPTPTSASASASAPAASPAVVGPAVHTGGTIAPPSAAGAWMLGAAAILFVVAGIGTSVGLRRQRARRDGA